MFDEMNRSGRGPSLYGFSPPKASTSPERNREIAASQVERVNALGADGVILYDVQEEPGRTGAPRPFPFLPALDPLEYARTYLEGIKVPKILYKSVAGCTVPLFEQWLTRLATGPESAVFVGAPTSPAQPGSVRLKEACELARAAYPTLRFGGVAIAERHLEKGDEDERLLSKQEAGCSFFVSQTVYDAQATKSLISDYALRFAAAGKEAPPFVFSFAPCGSLKTMEFMQWLGIRFPKWLENELRHSHNILQRSIDLCVEVADELSDFARSKGVVTGVNVESVSIRKEEIEASCVLFQRLAHRGF